MTVLDRLLLRHPREQGETYLEHARFAGWVGARMVLGGAACMVHAAVPALFTSTGSRTVRLLADRLASRAPLPGGAGRPATR